MKTERYNITTISRAELKDLLREPMAECGFAVDELHFLPDPSEHLNVETSFELNEPCDGSFIEWIKESPPINGCVDKGLLEYYLACLALDSNGDKAIPKTDYRLEF